MYDSDNIDDIPADAGMVMFYCDGEPGTPTASQLARFAGRELVPITRRAGVAGKVVDVEPDCVWPPGPKLAHHLDSGLSDTVYCSLADFNEAVREALGDRRPDLIIADYDNNPTIPVIEGWNVVGKQYATTPQSGGHFDVTCVSDAWPRKDSKAVSDITVTDEMHEKVEAADGKMELAAPIVDAVWVAGGCYMVAADGGVFVRDAAVFHGSMAGHELAADIVSILVADHTGYTLVAADGGTFRFGNGPEVMPL